MGSAFHQLCPRYSGTLTPTAPTAIRLWDTFTFFFFYHHYTVMSLEVNSGTNFIASGTKRPACAYHAPGTNFIAFLGQYICSAQSRNQYNSGIVLRKVGILTLLRKVGILTLRKTIPELSLRKVRIGTK